MKKDCLYLIDATAYCYRAFYALKGLSTSFGQSTNAIYGFVNILNKILKEKRPAYLAVCFDVSRDTFRQKKFAEYKMQRPPMPEGLSSQIPFIKRIIQAYGIAVFEKENFEADDIMATLNSKAKTEGLSTTIISSDKDILQLVDDDTLVFSPYKDEGAIYDAEKVRARYGVTPSKITDIVALMGDDVDNIPGLNGIGEKTAVELIREYGSLEELLKNIDRIKQVKIREEISDNLDKIRLNKELATLNKTVDIEFDLEKLKIGKPDYAELFRIFKYLEFKKFLKGLPIKEDIAEGVKLGQVKDSNLKGKIGVSDTLFLYGLTPGDMVFCCGGEFFRINQVGENLKSILASNSVKKISHNLKKIKVSLAREGITLEGLYFDTMIAAYLVNPSKTDYALNDVAWDYLGIPLADKALDSPKALQLITQLLPHLEKKLAERSLNELFFRLEMPLVDVLTEMELNGIKLDLEILKRLSREIEKRLIKLIEEIYALSGTQFNINSPRQLSQVLFEKLKLPVVKKTKTGPSTDEEVLKTLATKHKLPVMLLEYRQLMKLKNTYIDALPGLVDKDTHRIHSSFNQTGTETGRLSSSNPNLQNIPIRTDIGKEIRRSIVATGGHHWLLSCDYSQIELRILAHLSKDKNLIAAFGQDKDIHKITATLIYGLNEKDITDEMREAAKRINFGIVYGLSSFGLSRDLGISVEDAQGFIDAYFLRYPGVKDYIEQQIKKAQGNGYVSTLLGRRRYIPEINNKNQAIRQFAQRQAINTPIQGSASDLIKLAMVEIHAEIKKRKLKSKMLIQIHDELLFDLPQEESKELIALVRDKMEHVLKLEVPIKVDIKKGKNWLDMEGIE